MSDIDTALIGRLMRGEAADFGGATISAALLRDIVRGEGAGFARTGAAQSALHLVGARIAGRLELADLSAVGGGSLPALIFTRCVFAGGIDLSHAGVARLAIDDCRFVDAPADRPTIDLRGAMIASDVLIQRLSPETRQACLWLDASNARIDGDVDISDARFRAPPGRSKLGFGDRVHYAVRFHGTEIAGSLRATPGLSAEGGFSIQDIHVVGDVWLSGASFSAGEQHAFNGQSARIDGNLMLDGIGAEKTGGIEVPLRADGLVFLLSAQVGGSLHLQGIRIWSRDARGCALALDSVRTGKEMRLGGTPRCRVRGTISARAIEIGEDCSIGPISFGTTGQSFALDLRCAAIARNLWLDDIRPIVNDFVNIPAKNTDQLQELRRSFLDIINRHTDYKVHPDYRFVAHNAVVMSQSTVGAIGARIFLNQSLVAANMKCDGDCAISGTVAGLMNLSDLAIASGSLYLNDLRFHEGSPGSLILRNIDVGRKISFQNSSKNARPVHARRKDLSCLPGYSLVELLWPSGEMSGFLVEDPHRPGVLGQAGALWRRLRGEIGRRRVVHALTGQSAVFHQLHDDGAIRLTDDAEAEELLRLFCGYIHGNEGPFRVISDPAQLPEGTCVDKRESERELERAREKYQSIADEPGGRSRSWRRRRAAAKAEIGMLEKLAKFRLSDLGRRGLRLEGAHGGKATLDGVRFSFDATVLHGPVLFRGRFQIDRDGDRSRFVSLLDDNRISNWLSVPVTYAGRVIAPKSSPVPAGAVRWPVPETLPGMAEVTGAEFGVLAALLESYAPGMIDLTNATVDLTDATCDTLEDGGGVAWGPGTRLVLDRLTYRHAVQGGQPGMTPARRLSVAVRRWLPAIFGPVSSDEIQRAERPDPWRMRDDWLSQQWLSPDRGGRRRYPPHGEYQPQPYEQIIRVAREMGDEPMASSLEIRKAGIEGHLRAQETRIAFAMLGAAAAALWIAIEGLDDPIDIAVAACLLLAVSFGVSIGQFVLRHGFGYFRRPARALWTIMLCVTLGYAAVSIASSRGRMTIDIMPTASAFDPAQRRLGVSGSAAAVVSNLRCGQEINEFLYALDVFIPLIDLRQEGRCSPGMAADAAAIARPADPGADSGQGYWRRQAARLTARTIDSVDFWNWAKAIYGVIGWIVISLSIITFARLDRASGR